MSQVARTHAEGKPCPLGRDDPLAEHSDGEDATASPEDLQPSNAFLGGGPSPQVLGSDSHK